jgi:hypothetical protein
VIATAIRGSSHKQKFPASSLFRPWESPIWFGDVQKGAFAHGTVTIRISVTAAIFVANHLKVFTFFLAEAHQVGSDLGTRETTNGFGFIVFASPKTERALWLRIILLCFDQKDRAGKVYCCQDKESGSCHFGVLVIGDTVYFVFISCLMIIN